MLHICNRNKLVLVMLLSCIFLGCKNIYYCSNDTKSFIEIDTPKEVAERAYNFAKLYEGSETSYEYGGQDSVRSIKIDCSGLVIMCYKYALVDTKYQLLLNDMASGYIYEHAATLVELDQLRKGDLVFMGEEDSKNITHIAIFEKLENGSVYFIDSSKTESTDGVACRSYPVGDKRLKAYGIMRIKY